MRKAETVVVKDMEKKAYAVLPNESSNDSQTKKAFKNLSKTIIETKFKFDKAKRLKIKLKRENV